jgi:glycosyltransferase involved in cell wall biosynthesis
MNLITIICAVYNTDKYLKECLDSIEKQTYKDFDLILIDDCSTDNSGEICDEFARQSKIENIKVFHNLENLGNSASWEKCVLNAVTPWIYIVDSDDVIHPDLVKIGIDYIQSDEGKNIDVIRTNIVPFYKDYIEDWKHIGNPKILTLGEGASMAEKNQFLGGFAIAKGFIRREILINIEYGEYKERWPRRFYNDGLFTTLLYKKVNKLAIINENIYKYRVRNNSTGRSIGNYRHLCDWMESDGECVRLIKDWKETELIDKYICAYLLQMQRVFYKMFATKSWNKKALQHINDNYSRNYHEINKRSLPIIQRVSFWLFNFNKKLWAFLIGNIYFKNQYLIAKVKMNSK